MKDSLISKIEQIANSFNKFIESSLPAIRDEVNSVISDKHATNNDIELMLDYLLGFAQAGYCKMEFFRLNKHYSKINPEAAKEYAKIYREFTE